MRTIAKIYAWVCILLANKRRLIIIDHSMNHWEWPFKYFGKYYNSLENFGKSLPIDKYRWQRCFDRYFNYRITQFEALQYHNVEYRKEMTENEFFTWFYTDHQLPLSHAAISFMKTLYEKENGN